jgi:hypothetical protein
MATNGTGKKIRENLSRIKPIEAPRASAPKSRRIFLISIIVVLLAAIAGLFTFFATPRGKITALKANGETGRVIEIAGVTKNIPVERKYLWVAVDIPGRKLCWPKRPIHNRNQGFYTKFMEKGLSDIITVSLYAVDSAHNAEIEEWFDQIRAAGREPGMELLPDEFRLDVMEFNRKGVA